MTLGQLQRHFATRLLPRLLMQADLLGYEVTLGDAYRDPRSHGSYGHKGTYGRRDSNHKLRLAIDLNLFWDGEYLTSSENHKELGEYWESLSDAIPGVKTVWGGRWNDGNHYSIVFRGKK